MKRKNHIRKDRRAMQITVTSAGILQVTLPAAEAAAVRDDLGGINVSRAGDHLHSLLAAATEGVPALEGGPAVADCCLIPSYGSYLAHRKRGEDACEGSKAEKRKYDRERYARDPHKARAPQRAYEARQRAAAAAE